MKKLIYLALLTIPGQTLLAAFVVVPNAGTVYGGHGPFDIRSDEFPNMRSQEVFNQSAFGGIQFSPFYITEISYAGAGSDLMDINLENVDVRMSTSPFRADHQSSVFAANIGPDETVV